jgi:hypothetical protein
MVATSAAADLPEAARNRLLRRADWRFLLPDPAPARSVCYAGGSLRRAVAAVSGAVVDDPSPGSCDLAVAADPGIETLRRACAALRPGGTLYAEWRLPWGGRRLRRRLEAAGLADVALYRPWPWPGLLPARFWLPLDAPGAVAFARNNPVLHRHPVPGPGSLALGAAHRVAEMLGSPSPVCAVATLPGGDEGGDAARRRKDGSPLLLTLGPRSVSKVVALDFAGADPVPRAVTKQARVPDAAAGLRREAEVLRALPAIPGVPRVVSCTCAGGVLAVRETPLAGVPLWARLRRDGYRGLALRATDWLVDFARSTARPADGAAESPCATLRRFRELFGEVADPDTLRRAERLISAASPLPRVCEQRDFGPWNVLVAPDGALGVVDWESAEPEGTAGMDLVYFLSYLAFFRDGAMRSRRFRESYRRTLDPATPTGAVRRECLERYARGLGLDPDALRHVPALAWMVHARSEHRHLAADAGGAPGREALRSSVFLSLWEEEVRHAGRT